jgi:hypothetical protein
MTWGWFLIDGFTTFVPSKYLETDIENQQTNP